LCILQKVAKLGKEAGNSMKAVLQALEYLAKVVVQDALDLAEAYPANKVHAFLLADDCFR